MTEDEKEDRLEFYKECDELHTFIEKIICNYAERTVLTVCCKILGNIAIRHKPNEIIEKIFYGMKLYIEQEEERRKFQ